MLRTFRFPLPTLVCCSLLAGCGGGPPSDRVEAEITQAVHGANTAMFEGGKDAADVVSIKVAPWKKEETPKGPTMYESTWTASLRFKEPLACILAEVDGKTIVQVVAEKGEELAFEGRCGGAHWEGKWEIFASAQSKGGTDFMGPGAWKPIYDRVPDLKMGYQVYSNGLRVNPKFRTRNFESLSKLQPCVVEGSPEHKKLDAEAQERFQKHQANVAEQNRLRQEAVAAQQKQAQEEAAERLRKQQEDQALRQAAATEKQRVAQEDYQRKQAEAAERARLAKEEATQKAQGERHARLLAVMKPFQSATGAVITAEAGPTLGTVILDAAIDSQKLSVSGHAIDLREMPFTELTFDGSVDERGTFNYRSSRGGDPVAYGAAADKLASRAGFTVAALADADRAKLESVIALGKRLGTAAPVALVVETLDAEAAKTREPELKLTGLSGQVFHRGRLAPAVAPLFAADMGAKKAYAWKSKEVVALRLTEPVKGSGLYIRGTAAPSTELIVTINGVHTATISSIPKLGGIVLKLPPDLEVMDIRLEATGAVSARTIGLLK